MSEIDSKADVVGVILAAGRGSRMRSRKPKPLHCAAGQRAHPGIPWHCCVSAE